MKCPECEKEKFLFAFKNYCKTIIKPTVTGWYSYSCFIKFDADKFTLTGERLYEYPDES